MLFEEPGRKRVERLNDIYERIESVSDPRKRRAFVDSFYARFINETPLGIANPRTAEPIMRIVELGGEQYRKHVSKVSYALRGTTNFADGRRTNKEIAKLEKERLANGP